MRHTTRNWLLAVVLGLLAGCMSSPEKPRDPSARPAWIDNPGTGVSASAGYHVKGVQAQEELAITRAREEFAKRYGVVINSNNDVLMRVVNEQSTTVSEKSVNEQVQGKEVQAMVREKWREPNGTLWVWLVPTK